MILQHAQTAPGAVKARRTVPLLAGLAGICLLASLFFPLWHITLDAPQYPEGMGMYIWAGKITGQNPNDLDIINQLNHYIGMRPIVPEAIPELRVIAPLIGAFGILCLAAAFRPRPWFLGLLLLGLGGAGALGMYDFWRWEYDYGHNLDPRAAIRIPGMSYQPPLIGTAKLLNFTSSSWPAAGGCLLFAAGGLLALALLLAWRQARRARDIDPSLWRGPEGGIVGYSALALSAILASGCGRAAPGPIEWGVDACHHCKMALVQKGFAAQRLNAKGKVSRFDSIECLLSDLEERPGVPEERYYVSDLSRPDAALLPAEDAAFLRGSRIASPMGGSLAGFASPDSARHFRDQAGGDLLTWGELLAR